MKSSKYVFIALATTLVLGTSAYARGPVNAPGAGMQARAGGTTTATSTATSTQTRAQAHTPGTGLADPSLRVGPSGPTGTARGIHTPGTGLTTTTTTP